jgi:hypothetical protein
MLVTIGRLINYQAICRIQYTILLNLKVEQQVQDDFSTTRSHHLLPQHCCCRRKLVQYEIVCTKWRNVVFELICS